MLKIKKDQSKKINRYKYLFDFRYLFHDFVRVTGLPLLLWFRFKYIFIDKTNKKEVFFKPVFFVGIHNSFKDPFIMVSAMWFKRVSIVATKDLFNTKFKNALFNGFRAIKVDKENVSISTFKEVSEVIRRGHSVGIYPEGSVNKDESKINDFKGGVILMAFKAKAPIYPVYFVKKKHWYSRKKVVIGEKLDLTEYSRLNKDDIEALSKRLQQEENKLKELYKD